jgi:hypothetical protein
VSGGGHDERGEPRIDLSYPLSQLERAMAAPAGSAFGRAAAWRAVIAGIMEGVLHIGSRTPIAGTPAWVTPEVVHGGFATGRWIAGGPVLDHERALLDAIGHGDVTTIAEARRHLNAYHLTDPGREAIREMLMTGRYRIDAPEEGALMVVEWLRGRGAERDAASLLSVIAPWTDRLRFYPRPSEAPVAVGQTCHVEKAADVAGGLRVRTPDPRVEAMREALVVWTPMYDRTVALVMETVEDGRPFVRRPPGWGARAGDLLDEYARARAAHRLCTKPDKPKENFARLRTHLATVIASPEEPPAGVISDTRRLLDRYVARHGRPDGPRRVAVRDRQAHDAALPSHADLASVLADRIMARDTGGGVADIDALVAPLGEDEADRLGAPAGTPMPAVLKGRAMRALEAPIEELVDRGVVTSAEAVASLLPQLTAAAAPPGFADPALRGLYAAEYLAFRRRRSLLLANLASQVRLEELPWIAALERRLDTGDRRRHGARDAMVRASRVALTRFPETLLPNPLIRELDGLRRVAGLDLPLTYELAADIFQGRFSPTVQAAAQMAGEMMRGTLYARYYDLPESLSGDLAVTCRRRAAAVGTGRGARVAANGMVIEQAQILTTHNLAQLAAGLDLRDELTSDALPLAERCLRRALQRQTRPLDTPYPALRNLKDSAYAWRQMLFFLSLADPSEMPGFLVRADELLDGPGGDVRERMGAAVQGLRDVVAGWPFDAEGRSAGGGRRFLGWGTGRHWLPSGAWLG